MRGTSAIVAHSGPKLPRTTGAWVFFVLFALCALGFGVYSYSQEFQHESIAVALRNPGYGGVAWGLYIVFVVFFVGVSFAGIVVAAICRLFDIVELRPITRIAELLTITALIAGASCVLADLGRPVHGLLKLPRFANPTSPFFGTFTLVMSGYLFSSLVYFFLSARADAFTLSQDRGSPFTLLYRAWASGYRDRPTQQARHHKVSFVLALTILPLLVTAHSTLGFIFGIQGGRPGWFGALQAPAFVTLAGVSGTGMLILVGLFLRRLFKLKGLPDATFKWLGNLLWVLSLVYLYFLIVEELTATYAAPEAERNVAHAVVSGPYAPFFWTAVGGLFLSFLLPFLGYVRGRSSVAAAAFAGLFANIAAISKRLLIVLPSQTHGALAPIEEPRMYSPSWSEYGVIGGLFALVLVAMLLFGRIFPLVPSEHAAPLHPARRPEKVRRAAAFMTALTAVALIVFGLLDSFRLLRPTEIDPLVPYAAVIFATGVMLLFSSAVVYELWPEKQGRLMKRMRANAGWPERRSVAPPVVPPVVLPPVLPPSRRSVRERRTRSR